MIRQTWLFNGTDASGHAGLWETNEAADGTYELTGVPTGVFNPADFTLFNNEVLFQGQDTSLLYGIGETNGTAAGTTELGGFGSTGIHGASSSGLLQSPNTFDPDFTVFNGEVLFEGVDASGDHGLWMTNGTAAGTTEIGGIANGNIFGAYASGLLRSITDPDFTVFNGEVLFEGVDASGDHGLWMTNGTAAGTTEIGGIANGDIFGAYASGLLRGISDPDFTVFNGEVLFDGVNTSGHGGLWVTNGKTFGTSELIGISGVNTLIGLYPSDMTVCSRAPTAPARWACGRRTVTRRERPS